MFEGIQLSVIRQLAVPLLADRLAKFGALRNGLSPGLRARLLIRDLLESPATRGSVRQRLQEVQSQLDALVSERCRQLGVESETKAFIAGRIAPGGGPTHYDSYDNLALILSGCKIFYHASPRAFKQVISHGETNERLSVNPFDEVALNALVYNLDTHDCQGVALAPQWRAAVLEAGDVLF